MIRYCCGFLVMFSAFCVHYPSQAKEAEKKQPTQNLAPTGNTTDLKSGPMLDMHLINEEEGRKGPSLEPSSNLSLGTMVDNGSLFELGSFNAEPLLSKYSGHTVGVMWTGFLNIRQDASHLISLELQKDANADAKMFLHCLTELSINGKRILKIDAGGQRNAMKLTSREEVIVPATTQLNLKTGYYPASIWLACTPVDVSKVRVKLKLRSPADRVLREIGPEDFLHRG